MRKLRETSRQERELRLVIREMISEAGPVDQFQRAATGIAAAASSTAKAAASALSTGQGTPTAQAAPSTPPVKALTFTSATGAPAAVGSSDVAGVSMYGAKVGDSSNYTEYRVYTNGMIKRFGIMKNKKWTMDDPAVDILAAKLKATAQAILTANQYDAAAKAALDGIVAGTLTGTGGAGADTFQRAASLMRKALAGAGAPIAYVAFADYLIGRTSTFTENDLPSQYRTDLAKVAKYALSLKTPNGKKGQILHNNQWVYNTFWRTASEKLGQGTPGTPLGGVGAKGTGTVEALQFFLGGMVVTQEGQNYVISDIYDYDDYYVSPKAYDEMEEFLGSIAKAGNFYDVIRNAAGYRQSTGYTGYPVRIVLPVSLAADFKV